MRSLLLVEDPKELLVEDQIERYPGDWAVILSAWRDGDGFARIITSEGSDGFKRRLPFMISRWVPGEFD